MKASVHLLVKRSMEDDIYVIHVGDIDAMFERRRMLRWLTEQLGHLWGVRPSTDARVTASLFWKFLMNRVPELPIAHLVDAAHLLVRHYKAGI